MSYPSFVYHLEYSNIRNDYSSDRFLLEVTEITRPPLIIIDYSHFSCMSGNHIGTLFGIRNTLNSSLIRRYQY